LPILSFSSSDWRRDDAGARSSMTQMLERATESSIAAAVSLAEPGTGISEPGLACQKAMAASAENVLPVPREPVKYGIAMGRSGSDGRRPAAMTTAALRRSVHTLLET